MVDINNIKGNLTELIKNPLVDDSPKVLTTILYDRNNNIELSKPGKQLTKSKN